MTTISKDRSVVTLINVFTTAPEHQQRLIELLTEATDRFVRDAAGFISARLHRSLDGVKVTMYSQWRSMDDYQAMRDDPRPLPLFGEILKIASFEPGSYEVVATFEPE
jgi:quinol monooxygenase YgiN